MKPGMVVQIRINPKDCQSILDLMEAVGVDPYDGRSFAQCVSLALSTSLAGLRNNKTLPEIDTFQFLNRMGPFLNSRNSKRKNLYADMLTKRLQETGDEPVALELPKRDSPKPYLPEHLKESQQSQGWTSQGPTTSAVQHMPLDEATKVMLAEELSALYTKQNDGGTLTPAEQERYDYLNKLLFS